MKTGDSTRIDLVALGNTWPPSWMRDALCTEYEDVEFFITRGEDDGPAKSICARCAVKAECLEFALEHRIDHGVWGGTSGRERADRRRSAGSGAAREFPASRVVRTLKPARDKF